MILGYARVSTKDQNLDLQIGRKESRPELDKLLAHLWPADILLVYSLDRLGHPMKQLVEMMAEFKSKEIQFKSISEGVLILHFPWARQFFRS